MKHQREPVDIEALIELALLKKLSLGIKTDETVEKTDKRQTNSKPANASD